jgi:hypothetical protein
MVVSAARATPPGSAVRKTVLKREQPIEGPPAPARKTMVYPKRVVTLKKAPELKAKPDIAGWQRRMRMTETGGLKLTGGGLSPREKARIGSGETPQERAGAIGAGGGTDQNRRLTDAIEQQTEEIVKLREAVEKGNREGDAPAQKAPAGQQRSASPKPSEPPQEAQQKREGGGVSGEHVEWIMKMIGGGGGG